MTARPPNAAGTAGIGTAHRFLSAGTAADPAQYGTGVSTSTAGTTSPPNDRTKTVSDPLDDLCDQFSDRLSNLIMSALKNDLPARCAADALIQATAAVAVGASIDISGLVADLIDTVTETDIECDGPVYLH